MGGKTLEASRGLFISKLLLFFEANNIHSFKISLNFAKRIIWKLILNKNSSESLLRHFHSEDGDTQRAFQTRSNMGL